MKLNIEIIGSGIEGTMIPRGAGGHRIRPEGRRDGHERIEII
jgi:hypothetical protein